jgi:hypothetical protein
MDTPGNSKGGNNIMAVKSSSAPIEAAGNETVKTEIEPVKTESQVTKTTSAKKTVGEPGGFCVYIGPSIRGVIQSGTIYNGSRKKTEAFLSPAIEKYPLIAKLISTEKTFAEDRVKVKTSGNLLNVHYKKLASGKSN